MLKKARNEGEEQGKLKGIQIGKEKGKLEGRLETAKLMLEEIATNNIAIQPMVST